MKRIIDYYRQTLIFHPEKYICCCEHYDIELLTEESYNIFVYDQVCYEYNKFCKCEQCDDIWKELTCEEINEIKDYLQEMNLKYELKICCFH